MARKYGISTKHINSSTLAKMTSIEAYLGAAGIKTTAVAKTTDEFFGLVKEVYGVSATPGQTFAANADLVQAHISGIPRKVRRRLQQAAKARRAEIIRKVTSAGAANDPVKKTPSAVMQKAHREPFKAKRVDPCATSPRPSAEMKEAFYKSWDWRTLRMDVLKARGRRCECCGATPINTDMAGQPVKICVDHINPLATHWHLRLDRTNCQILCDECNQGKGAWDQTDWRDLDERVGAIEQQLAYVV